MNTIYFIMLSSVTSLILVLIWQLLKHWQRNFRIKYIRNYNFPTALFEKLRKRHPQLTREGYGLVELALRQFFIAYVKSDYRHVLIPSKVTHDLWCELDYYGANYESFCKKAFGRFLQPTPAAGLSIDLRFLSHGDINLNSKKNSLAASHRVRLLACRDEHIDPLRPTHLPLLFSIPALSQVWLLACNDQHIDPLRPTCLPLLFSIDEQLNISDGHIFSIEYRSIRCSSDARYKANCDKENNHSYRSHDSIDTLQNKQNSYAASSHDSCSSDYGSSYYGSSCSGDSGGSCSGDGGGGCD